MPCKKKRQTTDAVSAALESSACYNRSQLMFFSLKMRKNNQICLSSSSKRMEVSHSQHGHDRHAVVNKILQTSERCVLTQI